MSQPKAHKINEERKVTQDYYVPEGFKHANDQLLEPEEMLRVNDDLKKTGKTTVKLAFYNRDTQSTEEEIFTIKRFSIHDDNQMKLEALINHPRYLVEQSIEEFGKLGRVNDEAAWQVLYFYCKYVNFSQVSSWLKARDATVEQYRNLQTHGLSNVMPSIQRRSY